jgi:hypothetical protein
MKTKDYPLLLVMLLGTNLLLFHKSHYPECTCFYSSLVTGMDAAIKFACMQWMSFFAPTLKITVEPRDTIYYYASMAMLVIALYCYFLPALIGISIVLLLCLIFMIGGLFFS